MPDLSLLLVGREEISSQQDRKCPQIEEKGLFKVMPSKSRVSLENSRLACHARKPNSYFQKPGCQVQGRLTVWVRTPLVTSDRALSQTSLRKNQQQEQVNNREKRKRKGGRKRRSLLSDENEKKFCHCWIQRLKQCLWNLIVISHLASPALVSSSATWTICFPEGKLVK